MPRKAKIGATRNSYSYKFRVPDALHNQWDAYCQKQNKKPSTILRALMRYMIQDEMPDEVRNWIAEQTEGVPDNGLKKRMDVRFTPSEHQGVVKRAEDEGCSPQRWVINCVRASLTHEPQFTLETTKVLWESSYQLQAVGRNLNQITKRLHKTDELLLTIKHIEKLSDHIYNHTNKVAALTDASLSRWGITYVKD